MTINERLLKPQSIVNEISVGRDVQDVILRIPIEIAQDIQSGMADILCWCQGFEAAGKDGPMGTEHARKINMALRLALSGESRA